MSAPRYYAPTDKPGPEAYHRDSTEGVKMDWLYSESERTAAAVSRRAQYQARKAASGFLRRADMRGVVVSESPFNFPHRAPVVRVTEETR